ncbi:spore germination protein [Clostridium folliculivorans]|uniref:Spore germination protein KA n=1 Tax=Clostridium folliculivorans TaxID=2886038 RepID=A0A9W5Y3Y8_9CLOT|nr:spore germination protein [Clostridium folliculivorans]GKU26316.1 spore germination protein KA [Clostridium folliculivorans]GKU32129.1 spore germination protein KA [Clostridium folliculivorans]
MLNQEETLKIADWLKDTLQNSFDIEFRHLEFHEIKTDFLYITSICDPIIIQQNIITSFFRSKNLQEYRNYLISFAKSLESTDRQLILDKLLQGSVAVFLDNAVLLFDAKNFLESSIAESQIETVVQGPKDALREKLDTNLNIIRQRYPSKDLKIELRQFGTLNTPAALIYNNSIVNSEALEELETCLQKLSNKYTESVQQLHKYLMKHNSSIFPTILLTDRPDRVISNLNEGKITIIIEGSSFAMILPSVFFDFMSSMEDVYQLPAISKALLILRYLGLFISVTLPGFYVGISSYNPELFKFQLALSIAGNRVSVPYPSFVEVVSMLIITEILSESSSRLPKVVGPAATTVGGLIIGQAASEAGLISNIMVIIVSAVAISTFLIPINSFNYSIRIIKYPLLILSIFFGLNGIIVGIIGVTLYIANIRSFGRPYLQLFSKKIPTK